MSKTLLVSQRKYVQTASVSLLLDEMCILETGLLKTM